MLEDPSAPSIANIDTEVLYWFFIGTGVANLSIYEGASAIFAAFLQTTPPLSIITK